MTRDETSSVEFFAPYTEHVGTKAAVERLANGLENDGYDVNLIRVYREWADAADDLVVALDTSWSNTAIDRLPFPWKKLLLAAVSFRRLVGHLRRDPPDVLVAGLLSGVAIAAREVSGADTRVLVSVQGLPQPDRVRAMLWPRLYPRADTIVAPVNSIADRIASIAEVSQERIAIEPNPVITDELLDRGAELPDHPWFEEDVPVIVAVGRQTRQKDFETLLRAFADVYAEREARLVVPGKEGEQSARLRRLVDKLDVDDAVSFPGFVDNPYAFMASGDVFVLSSRWEGPGHVLLEALALGTPAISTDCPLGPREILNDGEAGQLVPVGDPAAMADAIRTLLDNPTTRRKQIKAGKAVADQFHVEEAVEGYQGLVEALCQE